MTIISNQSIEAEQSVLGALRIDAESNRKRNQWVYNSRGWRAYEAAYLMMRYKMARAAGEVGEVSK